MTVTPASFWDRVAPKYSKQPISDPATYARKLAATQALMAPNMNVLEFGCGTGSTALEHAPHVHHVDATDVSEVMIDIGREKAQCAGITNVSFIKAGVEDFTAPDASYDIVLALNLLHLLPDRAALLAKVHLLLKPGGIFVTSTPCLADRLWFLHPVVTLLRWIGKAPQVSFLKADRFMAEVSAAGFEVREHWTHGRINSLFLVCEWNGGPD